MIQSVEDLLSILSSQCTMCMGYLHEVKLAEEIDNESMFWVWKLLHAVRPRIMCRRIMMCSFPNKVALDDSTRIPIISLKLELKSLDVSSPRSHKHSA